MKYIMGIDVGTTGSKATVFDEKGSIITQSYREYPVLQYDGTISPEMVWEAVQEVIKECTGVQQEIEAVCTTSFGETVVLVNDRQETLGESILYTASGVEQEWKELEQQVGAGRLAEITGHISHPMYTISRLMWYRKKRPEVYEAAEKFLFFSGFINMKLCGVCAAEDTQAARSMAYDIQNRCWSETILQAAGIDSKKLPPCAAAGEILGKVKRQVGEILGFANAPLVIAGGQDQPCVALGMGAVKAGTAVYGLGTVECLSLVMDHYQQTEDMQKNNLVCAPHVVPGKYLTYGVLYSGGNVLKDLRNQLYHEEYRNEKNGKGNVYRTMFEEMPEDTELVVLPHTYGRGTPSMNLTAGETVYGMRAETKRGEMVLSSLRGLAFDMRENIEQMRKCGLLVEDMRVAGGGAKSPEAMQVRANALNEKLYIPEDVQAGTKGVFLLAAKSLGWIEDFCDQKQMTLSNGKNIVPEAEKIETYRKKYEQYQALKKLVAEFEQQEAKA